MNSITSNKNSTLLLLTALLAAILFAVYYYVLTPKLDEVEAKESILNSLNQEITSLQEQLTLIDETQQTSIASKLTLRNKVPQTKEIDKILLDIAEIEAVTGTLVDSIRFSNYDSSVVDSTITDPNAPVVDPEGTQETAAVDDQVTTNQSTPDSSSNTSPVYTITKDSLPAQLKLVTFSFDIVALDMQDLLAFIQEIEQIERIMKIDTVSISSPGEEEQLQGDADSTFKATIQITTFYYEDEN